MHSLRYSKLSHATQNMSLNTKKLTCKEWTGLLFLQIQFLAFIRHMPTKTSTINRDSR